MSSSSGTIGRGRNEVRGVSVLFDSSSRPRPDAFTNSEAFLGSVSSCGVTLIEMHAREGVSQTQAEALVETYRQR